MEFITNIFAWISVTIISLILLFLIAGVLLDYYYTFMRDREKKLDENKFAQTFKDLKRK